MAPISNAVRSVFRELAGSSMNLTLPTRVLNQAARETGGDIGKAIKGLTSQHPKAITTISGEIGDKFVSFTAKMQDGDKVVADLAVKGDASIVDMLRNLMIAKKRKPLVIDELPVIKKVSLEEVDKIMQNGDTFTKGIDPKAAEKLKEVFKG